MLPPQVRAWLWKQKVARGNRRIRELGRHIAARIDTADRRDHEAWRLLGTRSEWEQFRDERTEALRHSLGVFPQPAEDLKPYVARTLEGGRFRIENLVFTSRPGVGVTANLYRPSTAGPKMPALVICHSHHDPKADEELQCMGTTWAQLGCSVLIMDLLGHGERRQHPFASVADYPRYFEVDRQDYYSRYTLGAQLQLIGESLIGWMRWDLTRGIDLLLTDSSVDRDRIVLIGSVAGGGDVAGVVGALDRRVAAVVAFSVKKHPYHQSRRGLALPGVAGTGSMHPPAFGARPALTWLRVWNVQRADAARPTLHKPFVRPTGWPPPNPNSVAAWTVQRPPIRRPEF